MAITKEFSKIIKQIQSLFDLSSLENPGQKATISANIICKNNIKTIACSLNSLINIVDEVIIIDTGSTDGTIELVETLVKENFPKHKLILESCFQGYSFHRNQAIKESSGDWVLVLDSDEFLSVNLQKQLRKLAQSKIYSGYKFYRRWISSIREKDADYIFTTKFKGRYKSIVRFFRKLDRVEYRGEIHEAVFGLENKRIKTIKEDSATIYHLDVAVNSLESRSEKVKQRETFLAGSGHSEEYLPELFDIQADKVPSEDFEIISQSKGKTNQNKI